MTADDLTLPEAVLLLSLDEAAGDVGLRPGIAESAETRRQRAYLGAALMELYLQRRLRCVPREETELARAEMHAYFRAAGYDCVPRRDRPHQVPIGLWQFVDLAPSEHAFPEAVLSAVRAADDHRGRFPLAHFAELCASQLPRTPNDLYGLVADRLLRDGTVTLEVKHLLGIPRSRLVLERGDALRECRARLRAVILDGAPGDERSLILLVMARANGLLKVVVGRDNRDKVDWRIVQRIGAATAPWTPLASLANFLESPPEM